MLGCAFFNQNTFFTLAAKPNALIFCWTGKLTDRNVRLTKILSLRRREIEYVICQFDRDRHACARDDIMATKGGRLARYRNP